MHMFKYILPIKFAKYNPTHQTVSQILCAFTFPHQMNTWVLVKITNTSLVFREEASISTYKIKDSMPSENAFTYTLYMTCVALDVIL